MSAAPRLCLLLSAICLGLAGCSQYSALPVNDEPVRIAVLPVANESDIPQIIAPLARNVREKIAHSANYKLVSADLAEAQLQVTVLSVDQRTMARDPRDTGRPLSFHEEITVSIEWISESPAPWGADPVVTVSTDQILYAQPSLIDSRTSATGAMADRLADKIIQRLDWAGAASED